MKPNFALSLSLDGIRLLHRAASGWRAVGDVDLDAASLASELAVLRRTAASLEPGGVRTKLVIPNSQIRYLTIETPDMPVEARRKAAQAALDGATPYAVADLAFDISVDGDRTHVAAVALETLDEAESFACEHRFHPVSFVAVPDDGAFVGEPYFGATKVAATLLEEGESVTPDNMSTVVGKSARPVEVDDHSEVETADMALANDEAPELPGFSSRRRPIDLPQSARVPGPDKTSSAPPLAAPALEAAPAAMSAVPAPEKRRIPAAPAPVAERRVPVAADEEPLGAFPVPAQRGNSARRLLILMALLMLFLAGLAVWASTSIAPVVSGWFDRGPSGPTQIEARDFVASAPAPIVAEPPLPALPEPTTEALVEQASLETGLTDEDAAVLNALRVPEPAEPEAPVALTDDALRAAYAVTGIWPLAPDVPASPPSTTTDNLYVPSIDPVSPAFDAIALPAVAVEGFDLGFASPPSPAAPGTTFALDERGLVTPSQDGTLNPDGVRVIVGAPPARPPERPVPEQVEEATAPLRTELAAVRPQSRPADLIETTERANLDGLTRSELGQLRPRERPIEAQVAALAAASLVPITTATAATPLGGSNAESALATATDQAVAASLRPDARPKNFGKIVDRATAEEAEEEASEPEVRVASVAPRNVTPNIPSSASVSREATVKNAINLRQLNLIGIYGKPSDRRALVRLPNGRFQKVQVGDRIDGGRISAIGDEELRYQKGSRNIVLKMPKG
jgi:hypothetical protein